MKTFKKLFSVAAIVALLGTLVPMHAFGANYNEEMQSAYAYAHAKGITTMTSIDNADMFGGLTRIAMAKMIANYAINVLGLEPDTSKTCTFTDVSAALDKQYDNGVTLACQLGLMGQNITAFRPNDPVIRAEFGTTLSRALNANDADKLAEMNAADPYYKDHLNYLKDAGIMTNISNPSMTEVRGYVMLMMMRADDNYSEASEGCSVSEILACFGEDDSAACLAACGEAGEEEEEEEVNPGYITVKKDGSTSTVTAPRNAVNKKVGSVKLTAGENDSTVTALTVKVNGVSRTNAVVVNVMKDGVKIGTEKAVSTSSKSATIRLSSNLVIKAGKSEVLDIVATLSGDNGGDEYTFSVSDVTVVNGESAGLPITLGGLKTNNYKVETLLNSEISWATTSTLKAGKDQEQIATLSITPSIDSTLKGFTITRTGDLDLTEALANVKLYNNDVAIATATVTKDKIAFDGLDLESVDGNSISLTIKADTIYVGTVKTITTFIAKNDVTMVESESEEEMPSELSSADTIKFDGADFTITKMTSGNETVAPGSSNVVLFDAKITSTTEFDVTDYEITFSGEDDLSTSVFSKVTLYVNGVDYPMVDNDGAVNFKHLTDDVDNFTVSANQSARITVKANVRNTTAAAGTYKATLTINKLKNPEDSASSAFTVSGKSRAGDKVTISNGKYTTTRPTSMPSNKTIIAGEDEDVLYFNLKASAEDMLLKEVVIKSDELFSGFATSVSLMQGNTLVKEINDEDKLADGTIVFDGLNTRLNKDTTVPFTVRIAVIDDEVETLGVNVNVNLLRTVAVRAANTNMTFTGTSLSGNTYTISSTNPDVDLTEKDGVYTTMDITNKSSYDLKLETVKVSITRNDGDAKWTGKLAFTESKGGDNLLTTLATPAVYATWNVGSDAYCSGAVDSTGDLLAVQPSNSGACLAATGTWVPEVAPSCSAGTATNQTECEETIVTPAVYTGLTPTIPGTHTLSMPADTFIEANNGSLTRVFELLSDEYNITANDYTVKVTELGFYFADKDDHSKLSTGGMIIEKYTKTK